MEYERKPYMTIEERKAMKKAKEKEAKKAQKLLEKQRKLEEEARREREALKKHWWAFVLIGVAVVSFFVVMSILEKQGII